MLQCSYMANGHIACLKTGEGFRDLWAHPSTGTVPYASHLYERSSTLYDSFRDIETIDTSNETSRESWKQWRSTKWGPHGQQR